jgi:hypothetical protein
MQSFSQILLLAAAALVTAGEECALGDCKKKDCAQKFGAPYEIVVDSHDAEPTITSGELSLTVRYKSECADGGSSFSAHVMPPHTEDEEAEGGTELLKRGAVLYIHRTEAACSSRLPFEQEWRGIVRATVPVGDSTSYEFLAFPPGSKFDMYKIQKMP